MASSGKKGKKLKGSTIPLNQFLASAPSTGVAPTSIRKPGGSSNWADDVDDDDAGRRVVLPTAPRATWGSDVDDSLVPRNPPYTAFLSNLPYDTEEDELYNFFRDLKVSSVRLPNLDRLGGGKRGCGYVDFEDRNSLISALAMSETQLKGRGVRIAVADSVSDDRRRNMRDRERGLDPDRSSMGDWRSGPRDEPPPAWEGQRGRYGDRYGDRDHDRFGSRERFGGGGGGRFEDRERRSFGPPQRGFDDRDSFRKDDYPSGEPPQRPRLNLQPRTKPLEEVAAPVVKPPEPAPSGGAKAASVFGGAKPVDTAAREREIEERLARERAVLGVSGSTPRDSRGRERDWDRDRDRFSSTSSDRRREETWRNPSSATGGDSSDGGRSSPYQGSDRGRRMEQSHDDRGGSGQNSLDRQSQPRSWSNDRDEHPRTGDSAPRSKGTYIPPRGRTEAHSPSRGQERDQPRSRDRDSSVEDVSRMPKYQEDETPNFAASNKYAYLPSEDDPQATGSD